MPIGLELLIIDLGLWKLIAASEAVILLPLALHSLASLVDSLLLIIGNNDASLLKIILTLFSLIIINNMFYTFYLLTSPLNIFGKLFAVISTSSMFDIFDESKIFSPKINGFEEILFEFFDGTV